MQNTNRLFKKAAWTAIAVPLLYKTWWAYGWQLERKAWKEGLIADRTSKLNKEPQLVGVDEIPVDKLPKEEFDDVWLYKPVKVRGLFDHEKEVFISRTRDGERAYEVLTPLYTKVDKKTGDLHGIIVNRGRIPYEYKDSKMHHTPPNVEQEVEGVLMYSEGEDQYSREKTEDKWRRLANAYRAPRVQAPEASKETVVER